jgi:hypothetical protein
MKFPLLITVLSIFTVLNSWSQQKAFPGAQGFGAYSRGGRGGEVLYVENLNDSGPGSLRWAVEQKGPRTIVFAVSGIIELKKRLDIENPYITIAGQTAPGDGICLKGETVRIATHDVIVRYIRVRLGDSTHGQGSLQGKDAISISGGSDIILDHCSASWSMDEVISASTSKPNLTRVTVQWCFITEALNPDNHSFGSLIRGTGGAQYSFHYNLYAHNRGRNPRPGNYDVNSYEKDPDGLLLDFRNNVIYNWSGGYAGYNSDTKSITKMNYTGNFLIPGPDSENTGIAYRTGSPYDKAWFDDNYYDYKKPGSRWDVVRFNEDWSEKVIESFKQDQPFFVANVETDESREAFEKVLVSGGAVLPKRDPVDSRIVNDVLNRGGFIIDSQNEVGGWPELRSIPAPADTDRDGIPDDWERQNKLDPNNADDRNKVAGDGYTMLEKYMNSIK